MNRKTILTLGAVAAVVAIGSATIPAIAGGGPWGMTGGHVPGMMLQGADEAGRGPGHMGQRGGYGPMGMNGLAENPVFRSFDADKDGKVTAAETEAGVTALLAAHDIDKSGALSGVEFAALFSEVAKGMAARPFTMLDDDGNKEISVEEITFAVRMMVRMGRLTDINAGTPINP